MNGTSGRDDGRDHSFEWFMLQTPLNARGEWELTHCPPTLPNCDVRWLTKSEVDLLFPLFNEYNARFDIIIDFFESETIPAGRIAEALGMARGRLERAADPVERHGLDTLIGSLSLALRNRTFMSLDFGG